MTKTRSPNYPAISLPDAIERVKVVFDKNHLHPVAREVVAKALGYTGLNGASTTVISALLKYGLLSSAGDEVRVTDEVISILHDPAGSEERARILREVALLPALFRDLHDTYGDRPPGDDALRSYLLKRGFNPRTVGEAIHSYRATLDFINAETSGVVSTNDGVAQSFGQSGQGAAMQNRPPVAPTAFAMPPPANPSQGEHPPAVLPLAGGKYALLQGPFPLTVEEWEQLQKGIELYKLAWTVDPAGDTKGHSEG